MDSVTLSDKEPVGVKRSMVVRVIAAIFWFIVTVLIVHMIVGGVIGGMAGAEVAPGKTISDSYNAGAVAGQQASMQFMNAHGGKVFLAECLLWLGLVITGKYPWVSKFKR